MWGEQNGREGNVGTVVHFGQDDKHGTFLFFFGIQGSMQTIVQDILGSLIFEFMTMLKQERILFVFYLVKHQSI